MHENDGLLATLWRFLRPETEEIVGYIAVTCIIAGIAMYQLAARGEIGADTRDILASAQMAISTTADYLSSGSGWAQFFLFGFWFIVGAVAYFLAWFIINLIVDAYNDVKVSTSFLHPHSFHQSDYWASIVGRSILRGAAGIALGFYTIFWFWVFAPIAVSAFQSFFHAPMVSLNAKGFGLGLVGIIVTLHIAVILVRIMLLRPHREPLEDHIVHYL